ncbi:hypothetical protein [Amycolatopsis plumensis]
MARHTGGGITNTPAAWVVFTARTSQNTHRRPVRTSSPSRFPTR